jgi:hypothetical protein
MCQNPATSPREAERLAVDFATATVRELVLRRRNVSCRLTRTRAARSGIAIAKATAQIIRDVLREPFGFVHLVFLEPLGFVFSVLGHGHHRGVGIPEGQAYDSA